MHRQREQVLGESVVDLPRHAGTLLCDGTAELRRADRAPRADEHQREGKQAQELAFGHVRRSARRREDQMQRGEELQCEAEGEPLREVVPGAGEPPSPADHGEEVDQRLHR